MNEKKSPTYCIYGRKKYEEPLAFVKAVPAADVDKLKQTDENWVELVAFPETAAIHVIPREKAHEHSK